MYPNKYPNALKHIASCMPMCFPKELSYKIQIISEHINTYRYSYDDIYTQEVGGSSPSSPTIF